MRQLAVPAVIGVSHGVADAVAGLLLSSMVFSLAVPEASALVLLYNVFAFGGQPVAGMLVDHSRRPREATIAGLLLLGAALIACGWQSTIAVVLAGLGSALFHVGGGALAICATRNRATGPGFFAAPGVVGLAIGGAIGLTNQIVIWPFEVILLVSCLAVITLRTPPSFETDRREAPIIDDLGIVMAALLGAIALRSAVWNGYQFVLQGQAGALVLLALAACVGKILGGTLADRIGWRRWILLALLIATPLLILGERNPIALLIGVALLQSTTPVALAVAGRLLPHQPATASGLALGLAIAVGGVPAYSGLTTAMVMAPVVALLLASAALSFWWILRCPAFPGSLQRTS
jgi:FSR family fosmidomycin resistance protein-like MFS transporter